MEMLAWRMCCFTKQGHLFERNNPNAILVHGKRQQGSVESCISAVVVSQKALSNRLLFIWLQTTHSLIVFNII